MVVKFLTRLFHQGADQVFGDAAQSEASHHEACAILYVVDGFVGIGNYLVEGHKRFC